MKKMYKAMLLVLCAVLLVAGSVMGTLAYLQMKTETVTNTFTTGKVEITLKEYAIKADGAADTSNEIDATTADQTLGGIKLVPGRKIHKNPFITVAQGSEKCYLFVKVENTLSADVATIDWTAGDWTLIEGTNIYYYKEVVDASQAAKKVDVFKSITCENDIQKYESVGNIAITAYAVQAEGFEGEFAVAANAAWAASGFGN